MRKEIITCDGCGKTDVYDIQKTDLPRDEHWNMSRNDLCKSCRWDFQKAGWKALEEKKKNKITEDEIHAECMEFAYGSHGQG